MRRLWVLVMVLSAWVPSARAEVPYPAPPTIEAPRLPEGVELPKKDKPVDEPSDAEKAAEARRREKQPRVIVLRWYDRDTDYTDTVLQRVVRSAIVRPDASFYPEVDLYQNGRKVRDRTVVPAMQPARVPDENVSRVRDAVEQVSMIPWNQLSPDRWGLKAQELRDMIELLWFVDRPEVREPLFLLYAQIGRAAENQNQILPPFYEQIGETPVNYYFYLAATLAFQDPALMSKLTDSELRGSVAVLLQQLQQGVFPSLKIDFQQEGLDFDLEGFGAEYEVQLNGIATSPDEKGQIDVFLGRTDIYLKRQDSGHGLSERLEVTKLEDKIYFVRDAARKKMGIDFLRQLFLHPNECTPSLDGDILNYLAIYARIHDKAEIYVAVPEEGNPNRVYIWRYDRPTATLQLVRGGGDQFPVRFALLTSAGLAFDGVRPSFDSSVEPPSDPDEAEEFLDPTSRLDADLDPAWLPWNLELRGHINRLMVTVGAEAQFNLSDTTTWVETYRTPGNPDAYVLEDRKIGSGTARPIPVYNERKVARMLFMGSSVVLGRDAGIGFGPRVGFRAGWSNVPYALQSTLHAGWAFQAPGIEPLGTRVRPLIDVDARVGAIWPFKPSLAHEDPITVAPVFGLTAGIGTTF